MRGELKGFEVPEFMRKKMRVAIATGKAFTNTTQPTPESKTSSSGVASVACGTTDVHSTPENVQVLKKPLPSLKK